MHFCDKWTEVEPHQVNCHQNNLIGTPINSTLTNFKKNKNKPLTERFIENKHPFRPFSLKIKKKKFSNINNLFSIDLYSTICWFEGKLKGLSFHRRNEKKGLNLCLMYLFSKNFWLMEISYWLYKQRCFVCSHKRINKT